MTKKLRYFCTLLLMAVVGVAWAETTTVNASKVASSSATWNGSGNETWSVSVSGGATNQNVTNSYAQVGTKANPSNSITFSTSEISGTITSIVVNCASYSGLGAINATVGGNNFGTQSQSIPSWSSNSGGDVTFTGSASGEIVVTMTNGDGGRAMYIKSITVTYESGDTPSTAVATTVTIDASGITNTDVYIGTAAGSLTATVTETESGNAVSGATVTWTSSKENVATIDENGVVTLVAAGTTTITASYEGVSGEFGASSATYELTVTSSAPYEQPTEFEINMNYEWLGSANGGNLNSNQLPVVKVDDNVTTTITDGTSTRPRGDSDYIRLYKGSTLTFDAPDGYAIIGVEFTTGGNNTWNAPTVSTGTLENKIWSGNTESVVFTLSSGNCFISKVKITLGEPSSAPIINASDVNIAYDATSGEIAYTINNPVPGTLLQATADADWVSDITVGDEAITFTTTANEANTERVATFTLTYEGAEDKTVTVTQAAAPVVYTTIPDLFAAATSTSTPVAITFNNWVISAVKGSNAYLTDNAGNGLIIYQSGHGFNVNDVLSGTASCNLVTYQGSAELTALTASTEGLTVTAGGTVTEQNIAINELGGVNTGALLAYENLTYNGTALVDADNNAIEPYSTLYSYTFEADKVYNVKGIYKQYTTNTQDKKQILPRSADDIEEVVPTEPTVTVNPTAVEVDAAEHDGTITVSCENMGENLDISVFFCEETDVTTPAEYDWITADIDNDNNVYYIIEANTATEARTAYMVVKVADADTKEVYTSKLITFTQAGKELPSVTWDLTTDSYSSASEDLVTWTSDFATMTNAKGSSTTKANNYLGGNNNHTRFYKNQVLTITPQSGYAVTSIVINAISGNVNGFNGENAWTNATVSVNGAVVTVTPTNINLPVSVTISEACRATGVKVYYEESDVMVIEIKKGFTATTFSCDKALDFTNADVMAQIITDEQGTTQTVTVVPAETGLYITGEPGIHEISVADASAKTDNVDSNKLKAVMEDSNFATQNSVTFYAFGKQKGKEAFYKIPTSGYNIPAGKAVLRITKANAPEMIVVNGETTAIDLESGVKSLESGEIYNLQGQRVSKAQKGIYIVGGRKVVVK